VEKTVKEGIEKDREANCVTKLTNHRCRKSCLTCLLHHPMPSYVIMLFHFGHYLILIRSSSRNGTSVNILFRQTRIFCSFRIDFFLVNLIKRGNNKPVKGEEIWRERETEWEKGKERERVNRGVRWRHREIG
jgi:hypothetical protein